MRSFTGQLDESQFPEHGWNSKSEMDQATCGAVSTVLEEITYPTLTRISKLFKSWYQVLRIRWVARPVDAPLLRKVI